MAHQIQWYMGQRIIYALVQGDTLTLRELKAINDQILLFIRESNSPHVHVIVDASSVKRVHPNPLDAHQTLSYGREHNVGRSILITTEALTSRVRALWGGLKVKNFTSLEEGLFFLEDVDSSLLASV